jgi:hypothetical protein
MSQVFGEQVGNVLGSFNKEELNLLGPDTFSNEVVAQVNVFDVLFLYRIRGKKYGSLIVTI